MNGNNKLNTTDEQSTKEAVNVDENKNTNKTNEQFATGAVPVDENNNSNKTNEQPVNEVAKVEENNNANRTWELPKKKNPFLDWRFYVSFIATLVAFVAVELLLTGGNFYGTMIISIPYIIAGIIAWSIVRKKSRPIALGMLFGSIVPFIYVFIITGGCWLF